MGASPLRDVATILTNQLECGSIKKMVVICRLKTFQISVTSSQMRLFLSKLCSFRFQRWESQTLTSKLNCFSTQGLIFLLCRSLWCFEWAIPIRNWLVCFGQPSKRGARRIYPLSFWPRQLQRRGSRRGHLVLIVPLHHNAPCCTNHSLCCTTILVLLLLKYRTYIGDRNRTRGQAIFCACESVFQLYINKVFQQPI